MYSNIIFILLCCNISWEGEPYPTPDKAYGCKVCYVKLPLNCTRKYYCANHLKDVIRESLSLIINSINSNTQDLVEKSFGTIFHLEALE